MTTPTDLVSIPEAARLAGLHVSTLRRWIRRGKLQMYGYRGTQRVSYASVLPASTSKRAKVYYTPDGAPPIWYSRFKTPSTTSDGQTAGGSTDATTTPKEA